MFQAEERVIALDEAVERYKQGRCPCCGKGVGDTLSEKCSRGCIWDNKPCGKVTFDCLMEITLNQ